ncbi:uncharacterized protein V1516DRAFT_670612 [Lipomyces oligophaga]|uniref:uncharacterized protein n=1 Tax=Lipomyces oligophaga TaxID=45792 RepID=UPI0034CD23EC
MMQVHGPPIVLIYMSETGTSQSLAETLRRKFIRLRFKAHVLSAEDVERVYGALSTTSRDRPVAVFLCSTTGNGDIPRHARRLWKVLLRKKLTAESFSGLLFSSFGLGDSSYARFNWAARKLHTRMLQLGGAEVCLRGEGDESASGGVEAAFSAWSSILVSALLDRFPLQDGLEIIPDDVLLPPQLPVRILPVTSKGLSMDDLYTSRANSSVKSGKVVENTRITPQDHFQDTRRFIVQIPEDSAVCEKISPGSTFLIYAQNSPQDVTALLESQAWDAFADHVISVPSSVQKWATTKPLTLRCLLTFHLDIMSVPRASFFDTLSYFCSGNEQQLEKLKQFGDPSNEECTQDRYDYADRPRRSAMECLMEFDSVNIPVEYVLDIFGELKPRQFSIAGSRNNNVELLIAIVKYRTILRRIRHGTCTRFVSTLNPGDTLLYEIVPPKVLLPSPNTPFIVIGPGTGVAPLRALLLSRLKDDANVAKSILVFGNRSRAADFYYEDEWSHATQAKSYNNETGVLSYVGDRLSVFACFSRDGNKVKYVQTLLEQPEIAFNIGQFLVEQGAAVWVCGSKGKMPRAVKSALEAAVDKVLEGQGVQFMASLDKSGRYLEETW